MLFWSGPVTDISEVYTWYIPRIYRMSDFTIRNQFLFLAIYSSCILLFASIMSSAQTGPADPTGTIESVRFVCISCEQRSLPAFYLSTRACHVHMSRAKRCHGSACKKVTIMTRPGDVIAGGSGGMGPCLPPLHQPPGIIPTYSEYIPDIHPKKTYSWYIPEMFSV